MSHFNRGNVWGTVMKTREGETKKRKTPFLDLEIDCGSSEHGKVKAFGRLWGKEKIAAFLEAYKGHEREMFRFMGFYGQYEENGLTYSSYFLYSFEVPGKSGSNKGPRAAFILVGDLVSKELVDGEARIVLEVIRPAGESDSEEKLTLWLFDLDPYYEIEQGDLVEMRGHLRKREAEDFFGGSTDDPIRPYVMTVKKRTRG